MEHDHSLGDKADDGISGSHTLVIDPGLSAPYFRVAFECAPLGMMVLRDNLVVACNQALCDLFDLAESHLLGINFNTLFPGGDSIESIQTAMQATLVHGGRYRESRLMRQLQKGQAEDDGALAQVNLQFVTLDGGQHLTMCSVESSTVPVLDHGKLTTREREVASLLRERYTAKEIGRSLGISHRTVEIYRTRLMKKYGVRNAAGLVRMLLREPNEPDASEPVAPLAGSTSPDIIGFAPQGMSLRASALLSLARPAANPSRYSAGLAVG